MKTYAGISKAAFDLIVKEEVSSEKLYRKKYTHPEWPKFASGVTIGIGYDVGYATKERLWSDWKGLIPDEMIRTLERAVGVTGSAAKPLARAMQSVTVPWEAAMENFERIILPRWVNTVKQKLPNSDKLSPDCLGALTSLAYNRGPSFDNSGERFKEMRAIKTLMRAGNFAAIPAQFRSMKRLWPNTGLADRREREAALFISGLGQPPSRPVPQPMPTPKPVPYPVPPVPQPTPPAPTPSPIPPTVPKPDVIEDKPDAEATKPARKSTIVLTSIMGVLTSIVGFFVSIWQSVSSYASDPKFWIFIVIALLFAFIAYKRFGKQIDVEGVFSS